MSPIIEDRINNWWSARAVCSCPSISFLMRDSKVQHTLGDREDYWVRSNMQVGEFDDG